MLVVTSRSLLRLSAKIGKPFDSRTNILDRPAVIAPLHNDFVPRGQASSDESERFQRGRRIGDRAMLGQSNSFAWPHVIEEKASIKAASSRSIAGRGSTGAMMIANRANDRGLPVLSLS
jgi:hypothetical protein